MALMTSPGENSFSAHIRATLALGIPLIGAQLAQLGINTTDVIIIGQLGTVDLAAIVLAAQFFFVLLVFGSGFAIAVMPMVANAHGREDVRSVRRAIRMGMWVSIAYSLVTMPLFYYAKSILVSLGQEEELAAIAAGYLHIVQFGLYPALLFGVLRSVVSASGRAGIVLHITLGTLVLNAVLAYGVVLGHFGLPKLGMNGAAMVAATVQWSGFIAMVIYIQLSPETRRLELFARFWRPDWAALKDVMRLGFPIGVTVLAEVTLFSAASLLMGMIGTVELAAHGIALQLASIAFMIPLGLAQAGTVRVGIAHGRGDHENLRKASLSLVVLSVSISLVGSILFLTFPHQLAGLFLDRSREDAAAVLAYAGPLVVVAGFFQMFDGLQAVAAGLLRGLKDARVPMIIALIAYWPIGLVMAWLLAFPLGLGGIGVWLGFLIGLASAALMLGARFILLVRREGRLTAQAHASL
ncbi:MATE family efflux transporter [Allorhizobium sp. BGMRC 0089]|uniref:MATE family efflux transporter n=1 Tax=Allorhizobium sonneratiae TaxID=2934936 RepID=UPI00203455C8|nr:MATE family efflux transporter [Allorhizobium sonneratiae]MCM2291269.1 MATE family efflux transporter [Allorhizobium sonneratiae]